MGEEEDGDEPKAMEFAKIDVPEEYMTNNDEELLAKMEQVRVRVCVFGCVSLLEENQIFRGESLEDHNVLSPLPRNAEISLHSHTSHCTGRTRVACLSIVAGLCARFSTSVAQRASIKVATIAVRASPPPFVLARFLVVS